MAIYGCYSNLSRQHLLFNEQRFQTYYKENKLDQKLRPFSAVIPMWRDKTSSSTSRDSIGTKSKTVSGNSYKTLSAMQRCNKSYGPFQLLFRSGATRPPLQQVEILEGIQGKRPPETIVRL